MDSSRARSPLRTTEARDSLDNELAYPLSSHPMNRRTFLQHAAAGAAALALSENALADDSDLNVIQKEIEKRHDESVQRLQAWIRQPSICR
jgi:hypothetical protein